MRWHVSWMSVAVDRLRSDIETTAVAISGSRCAHDPRAPLAGVPRSCREAFHVEVAAVADLPAHASQRTSRETVHRNRGPHCSRHPAPQVLSRTPSLSRLTHRHVCRYSSWRYSTRAGDESHKAPSLADMIELRETMNRAAVERISPLVLGCLAATWLIWGSTYLAIDIGVQHTPPALLCGLRFSVAGVLMLAYCALNGRNCLQRPPR